VSHHDDFHQEPIPGLPARLPEGEDIVWQGSPERGTIARDALHIRKIGVYFAILSVWKLASGISDGKTLSELVFSVGITLLLGVLAGIILFGIATLIAKTTIYTVTNKRVVMRFGIAIPITFQFPFSQIISADVKHLNGQTGTLVFSLKEHTKISWLILWPHVRAWKVAKPQPALRAISDVDAVANLLSVNLSAAHNQTSKASSAPVAAAGKSPRPTETDLVGMNLGGANTGTA